jgi:hypothetical protein
VALSIPRARVQSEPTSREFEMVTSDIYRPLFDPQDGGKARAFECRLCPHDLSDKARCFLAGKRRPGRYVTASEAGIRIHLHRVHGYRVQMTIDGSKWLEGNQ